ncbi:MAG: uroporphyrinogen-III C-methyltransferase [Pseudomonadota bacterium]|nr:uroporphyrinogen-III C-methyltransferase [Pseudomonadota bacterium]
MTVEPALPLPSTTTMPGRIAFVGAGPGQADLITLRGAQRLAQAAVVLTDALVDPALRDLAPRARWLAVGKRGFADSTGQSAINTLLIQCAHEVGSGGLVVRLKGGDPSLFGRLEEELQAMADAGIDCEVVPGVTAALAAAASAQRPLTRRGSGRSVSFATAMTRTSADATAAPADSGADTHIDRVQASRSADTEVFYMAGKQLCALAGKLVRAGWASQTEVCVSSRAGWPDERRSDHTIDTLDRASLLHAGRPTVVVVGAGARPLHAASPSADGDIPASSMAALNT